jgi:ABC-type uncharacterized transport system substrate-binding protein
VHLVADVGCPVPSRAIRPIMRWTTPAPAATAALGSAAIVAGDLGSDPIARGFIASNDRPGGNIVGVFLDFPDFGNKWLEALKESVPQVSRIAIFWDPLIGPVQLRGIGNGSPHAQT